MFSDAALQPADRPVVRHRSLFEEGIFLMIADFHQALLFFDR